MSKYLFMFTAIVMLLCNEAKASMSVENKQYRYALLTDLVTCLQKMEGSRLPWSQDRERAQKELIPALEATCGIKYVRIEPPQGGYPGPGEVIPEDKDLKDSCTVESVLQLHVKYQKTCGYKLKDVTTLTKEIKKPGSAPGTPTTQHKRLSLVMSKPANKSSKDLPRQLPPPPSGQQTGQKQGE